MYTPHHYQIQHKDEILAFMRNYSFATVVSNDASGTPIATHLPLVCSVKNESIHISGHFAKANPQWQNIETQKTLVIFSEPHAYISPSLYDKKESVPTWNYVAVHAYGTTKLITEQAAAFRFLNEMIVNYEPDYLNQWNELSDDFKQKMLKGIVSFEITITDIQASKKLSQNKTAEERKRIINQLNNSDNWVEKSIASYMKKELE